MKTHTIEKSPLFVGHMVRTKKGDGIIIRDGGPGGTFAILLSKDAEKGYANTLIECRMSSFSFQEPDKVRDLCEGLLGDPPEAPEPKVEDLVSEAREKLGIKAEEVAVEVPKLEEKTNTK